MQLTSYTDYALRVLIYLGLLSENQQAKIKEIAQVYGISSNHLSKVVYDLGKLGLVDTVRGRNGGIKLAVPPSQINIGTVVRHTEKPVHMVDCFDEEKNACRISPACRLKGVLHEAMQAYFQVLDAYTLEDLILNKNQLLALINAP